MQHNELRKDDRVRMTGLFGQGPRFGKVMDNKKGITRLIHIEESNGHYPDMGSVYVDEITHIETPNSEWEFISMSAAHAKKMQKVRGWENAMFG